ncbi:MAG: Fe-S cluster assembly protein SufD [Saprospiraceae bacterium]|nr:Fe-S cluster assembly protein SufD [Saprospiraceae bacterium]
MSTVVNNKTDQYKEKFVRLFEQYELRLNGQSNHPYHQLKKKGMDVMNQLTFPSRRDEDWKYTSINPILKGDFNLNAEFEGNFNIPGELAKMDAINLVFLNGVFQKSLSNISNLPEGLTIQKAVEAFETEESVIRELTEHALENATQSLVGLNIAMSQNPFFIRVNKNTKIDQPVHLIYANDASADLLVNSQVMVVVEQGAEFSLVETFEGAPADNSVFVNLLNRFKVGANAKFSYYRVQNESLQNSLVSNVLCFQGADSTFNSYLADVGGNIVRNNLDTILQGSNTTTQYFGVYAPADGQHVDNQTFIDHALPHCFSNEQYKGVVGDNGRGVFNGKVMVRQDAQKTNAFQQNSNLLLSDTSVMDSKPQLEIFADDVKCSHGATIGQLDEDSVFYLRSRGLNNEQARSLLQYGFLGEVVDQFEEEQVRVFAKRLLQEKISK